MSTVSQMIINRARERNVLFNDALNTFYLRLYGVRHMVKDHSDSEKGTCCNHIGYSFRLTARVLLYAPSHRIAHTMAFVAPVVEHHERTLLPRSYISLLPKANSFSLDHELFRLLHCIIIMTRTVSNRVGYSRPD